MNANPMLLYRQNRAAIHEFNRTAHPPAVMNNKLEALKVLANSILNEIASLAKNNDIAEQPNVDLASEVQRYEADLIRCALTRTGGRQRRAAALLGIKPTTLHEKMKRYGMIQQPSGVETDDIDDSKI